MSEGAQGEPKASSRPALWVLLAAVAVVAAVVIVGQVNARRAQDARSDVYYCTLSGIGPLDRGPKTGRTCLDLLTD